MTPRTAWFLAAIVFWTASPLFGEDETLRPLRYQPSGTDFSITNGTEFFNRPLYCLNSAFRIDAGDKPEFSIYLPGRGGNLRFGFKTSAGTKWLFDAAQVTALYRPGSMIYHIADPLLAGEGGIDVTVLPFAATQGMVARIELHSTTPAELIWAYGGANGERGKRDGDIGTEREPVSQFFQLKPEYCQGDAFTIKDNTFTLSSKPATMAGLAPPGAKMAVSDANKWDDSAGLLSGEGQPTKFPVIVGESPIVKDVPLYFALQRLPMAAQNESAPEEFAPTTAKPATSLPLASLYQAEDLPKLFEAAEQHRRDVAEKVVVDTPDPFINAAVPALLVAGDGVWDERQGAYMHGAVAWRVKLLGWRGPYLADDLGWHDRAQRQFTYWAGRQNTRPVQSGPIAQDPAVSLARNEPALHSNGDISNSHYDMNLVYIDEVMRHLLWTGDLTFARQIWPVIVRHLAWEQRLFRRPLGSEGLPLYEAYCCIWASDDLQYEGGGATHATAYNYYHNQMAARLAKLLDEDSSPYEKESQLILKGMRRELWLPDRGWYGEYKDLLGQQLVHPNAALWTFYHAVDSETTTPFEAWQMTRFVDTQIPHIPLHGPGVPEDGYYTLPTTSWMPYTWSTNNVVMAEVAHTSLGYWEAGRDDEAFRMFKGCLLDSMYMGLCPGNVGMCTTFDVYRHESQRDFADAVGTSSRAMVEGLFGVHPDLLAGELRICPGFPDTWDHASIRHPDFNFAFKRNGLTESYVVESHFPKPVAVRLQVPALRDQLAGVTLNGTPAKWHLVDDAIGVPRIEMACPPASHLEVVFTWKGVPPGKAENPPVVTFQSDLAVNLGPARLLGISDPQKALDGVGSESNAFHGRATGTPGHRTVFAHVRQGDMTWWLPVTFEIQSQGNISSGENQIVAGVSTDWKKPVSSDGSKWDMVNLTSIFNDKVTQIFKNDYHAPRSPNCSLAMPTQGIGSWIRWNVTFDVDDSGLRAASDHNGGRFLVQDVPFQTPGRGDFKNIAFTSQWNHYPHDITLPLKGKATHGYFLLAGSTNSMQSRFENGDITITYRDGSSDRLPLVNPDNWWPIDQDYYIDDHAFNRPGPIPPRVDLKTGMVRVLDPTAIKGKSAKPIPGGAGLVLDLPLHAERELQGLTVHTRANEVVIGLMAVTLARKE